MNKPKIIRPIPDNKLDFRCVYMYYNPVMGMYIAQIEKGHIQMLSGKEFDENIDQFDIIRK